MRRRNLHRRAFPHPYEQIGAFLAELRQRPGMGALALQFCLLTAARTGEVTGATWDEVDLKKGVWTVRRPDQGPPGAPGALEQ